MTPRAGDDNDPRSLRDQVADALRAAYKPGARMRTIVEIAAEHGVSDSTVKLAVKMLREEGWVITTPDRKMLYARTPPGSTPGRDEQIAQALAAARTSANQTAALLKKATDLLDGN